jgi:hypothetical protein
MSFIISGASGERRFRTPILLNNDSNYFPCVRMVMDYACSLFRRMTDYVFSLARFCCYGPAPLWNSYP